ncbi:hypothetical protein EYF80_061245 [Liparis tanakae]|uniref:Uncharacterized protein n=1 Tax=Liparis tanakae TaxID=230148 RepID=A0A4Z2EIC8_9TELE|nr:hypothetical protein EYF80_061245 [Liparis tanakae]
MACCTAVSILESEVESGPTGAPRREPTASAATEGFSFILQEEQGERRRRRHKETGWRDRRAERQAETNRQRSSPVRLGLHQLASSILFGLELHF